MTEASRWLLLAGLVFAPWAYGSTKVWAVMSLSLGLIAAGALWIAGCLVRRKRPELPWLVTAAAGWLLAQGWVMTFNAKAAYQPGLEVLLPINAWMEWAPGTVEGTFSLYSMIRFTALAGALLIVCDLARRQAWRRRVFVTMAWTGVSIALAGLVFKLGGVEALEWIWPREKINTANNFAMFRYRGNAGAFLNLVLPVVIFRAWLAFCQAKGPWTKALWTGALFVVGAGIQFNPSRASWAIAFALAGAAVLFIWHEERRHGSSHEAGTAQTVVAGGLAGLVMAAAVGAIVMWGGWESSWNRLGRQGLSPSQRSPVQIYRAMVPDAGWTGFGPGTFEAIFPSYQSTFDYASAEEREHWTAGYWRHAHQDYYQALIEWGYLGTFALGVLVAGGLARAVRRLAGGSIDPSTRWALGGSVLALSGVLAHALVDFPFQVASIQLYAVVFLGTCWSAAALPPSPSTKSSVAESAIETHSK